MEKKRIKIIMDESENKLLNTLYYTVAMMQTTDNTHSVQLAGCWWIAGWVDDAKLWCCCLHYYIR
jgi:hypothetical protein